MITVVSVRVCGDRRAENGRPLYTGEWVTKLHAMADRNIDGEVRHLCLADDDAGIDRRVRVIDINRWWREVRVRRGWWVKVKLFDRSLRGVAPGERLIFFDLDTLIVRPLGEMIESVSAAPLAFAPDTAPNFKPPGVVKLYSSACMIWNHGYASDLFTRWTPADAQRYRGDQDWFGHARPTEARIDGRFFQRMSLSVEAGHPRAGASVIFGGRVKNHTAAAHSPWVAKIWSAKWRSTAPSP